MVFVAVVGSVSVTIAGLRLRYQHEHRRRRRRRRQHRRMKRSEMTASLRFFYTFLYFVLFFRLDCDCYRRNYSYAAEQKGMNPKE